MADDVSSGGLEREEDDGGRLEEAVGRLVGSVPSIVVCNGPFLR